jgi:hypothetical protein
MKIETVKNWDLYAKTLTDMCGAAIYDRSFIFRGHGKEKYDLITSFDRSVKATLKQRNVRFNDNLEKFKVSLRQSGVENFTHEQLIGLAQHHGLPTRVLDWSYSPYVAAFFAIASFLNSDKKEHPVVWVLNRKKIDDEIDPAELRIIEHNPLLNERSRHQKGLFTEIRSDVERLDDFLKSKSKLDCLMKVRIEPSIVQTAIKSLSLMDISYERLFPGLDGAAKQIWFEFQAT